MAQIDVSDLLSDPDFIDTMSLISRVPSISSYGEQTLADTTLVSVGSIQPVSGATLKKLPEALQNENVRSFWFKGTIVATAPGQYPSVLSFQGNRFQVRHVFDWTNWGAGWTEGACVAEVPAT